MFDERLYLEKIWGELPNFPGYYANIYGDVISMKAYKSEPLCRPMTVYGKGDKQYVRLQDMESKSTKVYISDIVNIIRNQQYLTDIDLRWRNMRGYRRVIHIGKNNVVRPSLRERLGYDK